MAKHLGHCSPLGLCRPLGPSGVGQRRPLGASSISFLDLKTFYPNGFPTIVPGEIPSVSEGAPGTISQLVSQPSSIPDVGVQPESASPQLITDNIAVNAPVQLSHPTVSEKKSDSDTSSSVQAKSFRTDLQNYFMGHSQQQSPTSPNSPYSNNALSADNLPFIPSETVQRQTPAELPSVGVPPVNIAQAVQSLQSSQQSASTSSRQENISLSSDSRANLSPDHAQENNPVNLPTVEPTTQILDPIDSSAPIQRQDNTSVDNNNELPLLQSKQFGQAGIDSSKYTTQPSESFNTHGLIQRQSHASTDNNIPNSSVSPLVSTSQAPTNPLAARDVDGWTDESPIGQPKQFNPTNKASSSDLSFSSASHLPTGQNSHPGTANNPVINRAIAADLGETESVAGLPEIPSAASETESDRSGILQRQEDISQPSGIPIVLSPGQERIDNPVNLTTVEPTDLTLDPTDIPDSIQHQNKTSIDNTSNLSVYPSASTSQAPNDPLVGVVDSCWTHKPPVLQPKQSNQRAINQPSDSASPLQTGEDIFGHSATANHPVVNQAVAADSVSAELTEVPGLTSAVSETGADPSDILQRQENISSSPASQAALSPSHERENNPVNLPMVEPTMHPSGAINGAELVQRQSNVSVDNNAANSSVYPSALISHAPTNPLPSRDVAVDSWANESPILQPKQSSNQADLYQSSDSTSRIPPGEDISGHSVTANNPVVYQAIAVNSASTTESAGVSEIASPASETGSNPSDILHQRQEAISQSSDDASHLPPGQDISGHPGTANNPVVNRAVTANSVSTELTGVPEILPPVSDTGATPSDILQRREDISPAAASDDDVSHLPTGQDSSDHSVTTNNSVINRAIAVDSASNEFARVSKIPSPVSETGSNPSDILHQRQEAISQSSDDASHLPSGQDISGHPGTANNPVVNRAVTANSVSTKLTGVPEIPPPVSETGAAPSDILQRREDISPSSGSPAALSINWEQTDNLANLPAVEPQTQISEPIVGPGPIQYRNNTSVDNNVSSPSIHSSASTPQKPTNLLSTEDMAADSWTNEPTVLQLKQSNQANINQPSDSASRLPTRQDISGNPGTSNHPAINRVIAADSASAESAGVSQILPPVAETDTNQADMLQCQKGIPQSPGSPASQLIEREQAINLANLPTVEPQAQISGPIAGPDPIQRQNNTSVDNNVINSSSPQSPLVSQKVQPLEGGEPLQLAEENTLTSEIPSFQIQRQPLLNLEADIAKSKEVSGSTTQAVSLEQAQLSPTQLTRFVPGSDGRQLSFDNVHVATEPSHSSSSAPVEQTSQAIPHPSAESAQKIVPPSTLSPTSSEPIQRKSQEVLRLPVEESDPPTIADHLKQTVRSKTSATIESGQATTLSMADAHASTEPIQCSEIPEQVSIEIDHPVTQPSIPTKEIIHQCKATEPQIQSGIVSDTPKSSESPKCAESKQPSGMQVSETLSNAQQLLLPESPAIVQRVAAATTQPSNFHHPPSSLVNEVAPSRSLQRTPHSRHQSAAPEGNSSPTPASNFLPAEPGQSIQPLTPSTAKSIQLKSGSVVDNAVDLMIDPIAYVSNTNSHTINTVSPSHIDKTEQQSDNLSQVAVIQHSVADSPELQKTNINPRTQISKTLRSKVNGEVIQSKQDGAISPTTNLSSPISTPSPPPTLQAKPSTEQTVKKVAHQLATPSTPPGKPNSQSQSGAILVNTSQVTPLLTVLKPLGVLRPLRFVVQPRAKSESVTHLSQAHQISIQRVRDRDTRMDAGQTLPLNMLKPIGVLRSLPSLETRLQAPTFQCETQRSQSNHDQNNHVQNIDGSIPSAGSSLENLVTQLTPALPDAPALIQSSPQSSAQSSTQTPGQAPVQTSDGSSIQSLDRHTIQRQTVDQIPAQVNNHTIQRQIDDQTPAQLTESTLPNAWSNIEDLVTHFHPTSNADISAKDLNPQAVSHLSNTKDKVASPIPDSAIASTASSDRTIASEYLTNKMAGSVQRKLDSSPTHLSSAAFASTSPTNIIQTAQDLPTVTIRSSSDTSQLETDNYIRNYSQYLELLAQEVYSVLRQRLCLEQERRGPKYPR
ncbi:hypothetical protein D0962_31875 [Leptolyngbyaceae cyanobacterium CCMR0082]|uniref:Uncharacterized protein n=1 Tax=Adonisia turfae CCMR0082 TaxID=2304604 RepID=A0A6M0SH40_9CYAN|nr:hypothetical protein [Adonisia turfae]NEZ67303.1 hypothetical protein [Adonisia turfae CCMR0082]